MLSQISADSDVRTPCISRCKVRGDSRLPLIVAMLLLASLPLSNSADAQRPGRQPFDFSNPQQFFENFLGRESEEDRATVQEVEVSVKEEKNAGERAFRAYRDTLRRQNIRVVNRGQDVEYLQKLVHTLHPLLKNHKRYPRIQVYVADSKSTDARSFPSGILVFHRGLFDFVENEAAMIGIVGHELSHLDRGHQLDGLKRMKLAQKTFQGGSTSPEQFFRNGSMMMKMFMRPFRPEDELQADEDGTRWAYEAGYDPRELAHVFRKLAARDGTAPSALPEFFRTHPYHSDRLKNVLRLYDTLQRESPRRDLYVGNENLAGRITRSEKVFP